MNGPDNPFSFASVAGHKQIKNSLLKLVFSDDKPNAMVFSGAEGIGKLLCATCYAAACLCENPNDLGACGECNACKSIAAGMNLNLCYWYKKKQNTTIEQMRQLTELANFAPVGNARYKINIIQEGDSLNDEASNSILKTIEDSPEYLITIILYNNPANVLPTIRSRSFSLRFQPLENDIVLKHITGLYGDTPQAHFAAAAASGAVGRACLYMNAVDIAEARQLVSDVVFSAVKNVHSLLALSDRACEINFNGAVAEKVRAVSEKKDGYVVKDAGSKKLTEDEIRQSAANFLSSPFVPQLSQTENIAVFCELLCLWLRDILLIKTDGPAEQLVNADRVELLRTQAAVFGNPGVLTEMIREIWRHADRLKRNANTHLTIDSLMCCLYSICRGASA